jgi:CRISPR/Cas system CSM-associated protein Csm5 (group 7 of RAMP superfamily)
VKKLDKNQDGKISVDEFIDYYIDGELRIKQKQNDIVRMMAERVDRREQTQRRLSQIENTEDLNQHGIMPSSKIKIRCFGCQDLNLSNNKFKKGLQD